MLRADPMPWLMDNASDPIRYRVLTELLGRGRDDPEVQKVRPGMLSYGPALQLQKTQRKDGTWGGVIHAGDPRKYQNCTENGLLRLYEYGWNREFAPVKLAAKTLRTFLTQKKDLKFFEFAKAVKADDRRDTYYRWFLRTVALGLLVRAGYLDERTRARSDFALPT